MMSEQLGFDYYYGIEAEQFSFYRVPRLLIKDKRFENLSSDARLLYGLMLDRMSLSMKNGWLDAGNKVYIYYTVEEIMKDLSCARGTAGKIMAELDSKKGIGLIEKKRQGLGKPDMIYVKNFATVGQEKEKTDKSENDSSGKKSNKSNTDIPQASNTEKSNMDFHKQSDGRKNDKSNMSNYMKTETSDTEIPKESSYQTTHNLDERMQNDRTETKEKALERSSMECMEFEFPEVQNLDFRELEDYDVAKGSNFTQNDEDVWNYYTEVGLQEDSIGFTYEDDKTSYMKEQTQSKTDDVFTEEELETMRQLGIPISQSMVKNEISFYEKQKNTECIYSEMPYQKEKECEKQHFSRSSEIEFPEVQNLDFKKFKSCTSRNSKVELADIQDLDPNYTNINYTDKSYTDVSENNPIYPINRTRGSVDGCDGLDNSSAYISVIKENLDYDTFMQDTKWKDRELYEELFQLVCDVVCVKRNSVRIAGENYPYELVKAKFLKLNSSHITYVMECMQKTVSKIGNIKAYMTTALYNATSTMSHYYQQAVQHDMYGGGWGMAGTV